MKAALFFLFWLLLAMPINISGQTHFIEFPSNQFKVKENDFYSYNYTISSFPYWAKTSLDTINNCRVRRNKIKSVTIYQFYSATDSAYVTTVQYDSLGLPWYLKPNFSANEIKCIPCDSIFPERNPPGKIIRKRNFQFKEKWYTDKDGYVMEYKRINSGLFNRIMMNWIGLYDEKIIYTYDALHLSVTATVCSPWIISSKKCIACCDARYEYNMDSKGDLLSEYWYRRNKNGVMELTSGYTYHYEYY